MKLYYLIFGLIFILSCSKKTLAVVEKKVVVEKKLISESKNIFNLYNQKIANQQNKPVKFSSTIETTIKGNNVNLNAEIYIEQNKLIWVNLLYFGFSAGKILITENKIEGYEKLTKTYFSEDISALKQKINLNYSEINLQSLQNLLIGRLFLNSNQELHDFDYQKINDSHLLTKKINQENSLSYQSIKFDLGFNPLEIVLNNSNKDKLNLNYEWNEKEESSFPKSIAINLDNVSLNKIKNKKFEFISFNAPFEIPTNYKKRNL